MTAKLFDPDPWIDERSMIELLAITDDARKPVSVRGRALAALGKRAREPAEIALVTARIDQLRHERIMGTVSVAHLGVGGMLASGHDPTIAAARDLIAHWEQPDKTDLLWLLEDAGLA